VDESNGIRVPVGIITDRDLVIGVMALKLDPEVFTVGDLIHEELVTARASQGVFETLKQMRVKGVRRMPIVDDEEGNLVGILSVDDIVHLLAEEMRELSKLITREQRREKLTRT
jgi:CBS domain-containing protein